MILTEVTARNKHWLIYMRLFYFNIGHTVGTKLLQWYINILLIWYWKPHFGHSSALYYSGTLS